MPPISDLNNIDKNLGKRMNILFDDIIFNIQRYGGISVYWTELSKRLEGETSRVDLRRDVFAEKSLPVSLRRMIPEINKFNSDDLFIFHSSYYRSNLNSKARNVVTVYDFTHRKFGSGFRNKLFTWQQSAAIKRADEIICISNNTKNDLIEYFPTIEEKRVNVVYVGVSEIFSPKTTLLESTNGEKPYALFVGSRADYKNFRQTVIALKSLPINLVIAGSDKPSIDELALLDKYLSGRWTFEQFPSTVRLRTLYQNSVCLVYPSSYEGFGIPLLEAMKCGVPAVVCRNSSLQEIAGPTTILIDGPDPDEIKAGVELALTGFDSSLVEQGSKHAALFTWDRCCEETLAVYEKALVS
jgi:mannosyltransferase